MTENRNSKMSLEQERRIAELQERVNRLENLCYAAKEVLNLEEAATFLGIAKSTLYMLSPACARCASARFSTRESMSEP